jgi:pimeloyl-ACP methyl ester carboxylesterase
MAKSLFYRRLAWLLLTLYSAAAVTDEIALPLSSGKTALADFRPGEKEKPAIFLLHGFLQTYRFSTIQLIAEALADNGYTVLAPTLTLNIDQRRNSLGCEAIQNHKVADSNREIADWMGWLKQQGYPQIVAIGHSSGSMQLLSYLSEQPLPAVDYFIATAIGPIGDWHDPEVVRQQLATAQHEEQQHPGAIQHYTLGFCQNNYTAPAAAYLSYMQWSGSWVLQRLKQLPVPLHLILGGGDKWLPPDWGEALKGTALPLSIIDEATHNFTGPQEFEFQETITALLDKISVQHL